MKLYYNYFIFKSIFHNRYTLLLFFPAISFGIFISMIIDDYDGLTSSQMTIEKVQALVFIATFIAVGVFYPKALKRISKTFEFIKYSNFYTASFKLFGEKDQRLFHQYVLESILSKDLNLKKFAKQFENSPKWQRILLEELNSTTFKTSFISELDFPRFVNEVSNKGKKSGWIRDHLNYKTPFERAFFIASKYASIPSILNNIDSVKQAIITNINITDNGVQLDAKGLKMDINKVNKEIHNINLRYRILLNPRITQEQFVKIMHSYGEENLNGFKAVRFVAFFTGFSIYEKEKYNCQNIFTPYSIDLTDDETKEFIAFLRFLMDRKVILGKEFNTDSKLAEIVEILVENCLLSSETIRRNFSETYKHRKSLHPDTMRKINTAIDKDLPPL